MTKKSIIILVASIIVFCTLIVVLCWGLQPVQKDSVSLTKLNKEMGAMYRIPSQLPFEGDAKCFIIYNLQHKNIRFELSDEDITGYSIELKDSNRYISIETNEFMTSINEQEGALTGIYKNKEIYYIFDAVEENSLLINFETDSKLYQLKAKYNKSVNIDILKSDVECILDQMIK